MPDILLRTSQVGSYAKKSDADFQAIVHQYRERDSNGYLTGNVIPETLEQFKQKYDVSVSVAGVSKSFGLFAVKRSEQLAVQIERQELAKDLVTSVFVERERRELARAVVSNALNRALLNNT